MGKKYEKIFLFYYLNMFLISIKNANIFQTVGIFYVEEFLSLQEIKRFFAVLFFAVGMT